MDGDHQRGPGRRDGDGGGVDDVDRARGPTRPTGQRSGVPRLVERQARAAGRCRTGTGGANGGRRRLGVAGGDADQLDVVRGAPGPVRGPGSRWPSRPGRGASTARGSGPPVACVPRPSLAGRPTRAAGRTGPVACPAGGDDLVGAPGSSIGLRATPSAPSRPPVKVLVTGSAGLIGSEAVTFFDGLGFAVDGIDNNGRADFFGPARRHHLEPPAARGDLRPLHPRRRRHPRPGGRRRRRSPGAATSW